MHYVRRLDKKTLANVLLEINELPEDDTNQYDQINVLPLELHHGQLPVLLNRLVAL
ncbi:hypothetical protein [Nostoc sp. CCY0012]|uniref:hypothetical protein n=1 Tax=Nostoc sp. CCY0012 TaxID=1056123 RepID=UPI0039C72AF1